MDSIPKTLENIISDLSKLPGIGRRTAERLAIFLLESDSLYLKSFSKNINDLDEKISECVICHCFIDLDIDSHENKCLVCSDDNRNKKIVCLLKKPSDVIVFERTGYNGQYHILGNLISPIDGINEEDLNIATLIDRINTDTDIEEVLIATDASIEGDSTALLITDKLKDSKVKISRLARGLPIGGTIEHVDQTTLSKSIDDRIEL
ncbi:MAG: recombination protein RecR [Candidatus Pelagibacter sp. TMED166]|nr:MAG: recombination protein RecR [Candidatus Pelagibacter sp. TMED166]|tara:strand:- start:2714 stop:3331 length:618 start_codon:yes stop_codon:yes gene_type:complete